MEITISTVIAIARIEYYSRYTNCRMGLLKPQRMGMP